MSSDPVAIGHRLKVDEAFMRELARAIGDHTTALEKRLAAEIAALKAEVAELRASGLKYAGVWQRANGYARGSVVTWDGCMFVAIKDTQPADAPARD